MALNSHFLEHWSTIDGWKIMWVQSFISKFVWKPHETLGSDAGKSQEVITGHDYVYLSLNSILNDMLIVHRQV